MALWLLNQIIIMLRNETAKEILRNKEWDKGRRVFELKSYIWHVFLVCLRLSSGNYKVIKCKRSVKPTSDVNIWSWTCLCTSRLHAQVSSYNSLGQCEEEAHKDSLVLKWDRKRETVKGDKMPVDRDQCRRKCSITWSDGGNSWYEREAPSVI